MTDLDTRTARFQHLDNLLWLTDAQATERDYLADLLGVTR